jgi:hypothetical protein
MNMNAISNAAKAKGWSRRQRGKLMIGINWLRHVQESRFHHENWRHYRVMCHMGALSKLRETPLYTLLIGADAADPNQIFNEIEKYLGLK